MEAVTVRGVAIGQGRPKIIVPLMGGTEEELRQEAQALLTLPAQLAEWRVDWFQDWDRPDRVVQAAAALRAALGELPLLATFRTAREGGRQAITTDDYVNLIKALADSGQVDLIDVELMTGDETVSALAAYCRARGVKTVFSNHDFDQTPPEEELVARLERMEALGADIAKIAVMPRSPEDVLALLSATRRRSRQAARPVVTMSMGGLGAVSRLAGEAFGSALTFGCGENASAPGQIPAGELERILNLLHTGQA